MNVTETTEALTANAVETEVEGLLFDMDGVLVQSTVDDERCWSRWASRHGDVSFDLRRTHGRRASDVLRDIFPGVDEQTVRAHVSELDAFLSGEQRCVEAYAGVDELLRSLPAYRWAVVTSASESMMRSRLAAAGLPAPRQSVGGDMVRNGKPDPESYLRGAALLARQPGECLVIEDAPAGIRAGKAAGCQVLAVASTHRAEELQGADWVVGSLAEVHAKITEASTLKLCFPALRRLAA